MEDLEEHHTPHVPQPLASPPSTGGLSGSTQYGHSPTSSFTSYKNFSRNSPLFASSTIYPANRVDSEASLLSKHKSPSLHPTYEDFAARHKCEFVSGVKGSRRGWLSIVSILLSVYSTIFSGIFFFIAIIGPSYPAIRTNGKLTASSAAFLTSLLAKTVELSFVTVIIALIGQELARKASSTHRRSGVTLAELSMRSWIVQPGTMIYRWESVRYAGITTLGLVSVAAAVFAMLYTSAATALVQPRLKFGDWALISMKGNVRASFANPFHVKKECYSPLAPSLDEYHRDETCISIEHAAMGYHNYYDYLKVWSETPRSWSPDSAALGRPNGTALLNNDTSVTAPWVDHKPNVSPIFDFKKTGVIVNNVSLAFPHTGVASAAKDVINEIMQPEDLDGLGIYRLNASVPSPVVNVLCATLSEDHLAPLIFDQWRESNGTLGTEIPYDKFDYTDQHPRPYFGGTTLDDIFEWGEQYGDGAWPPIFQKLPDAYNTMVNNTQEYNRTSIYILGKSNFTDQERSPSPEYFLCQLQVSQTPYCYTTYQKSAQGATLEAICGDEDNTHAMQYIASVPNVLKGKVTRSKDWPSIAGQWALALALNDGSFRGNSSNARLLSQLSLREPELDPTKPSLAEVLAVLAGCTLLQSTLDAPFVPFWNYTTDVASANNILNDPAGVYEPFHATIRAQRYASGGSEPYQKAFHVVLLGVFALNVMALLYFALHKTWYTDFSEPPNLFTLAVNSPPSDAFSGCCGTGPQGKDYGVAWTLEQVDGHVYVHSGGRRGTEGIESGSAGVKRRKTWRSFSGTSVGKGFGKLGRWSREV